MPDNENKNHNRGTLWNTNKAGWTGKVDVENVEYYAAIVASGAKSESAPTHKLYIEDRDDHMAQVVSLFKPRQEKKNLVANGSTDSHWFSVYLEPTTNGHVLRIAANQKNPRTNVEDKVVTPDGNEAHEENLPF